MELLKNTPDKFYELAIVDPPYGIGRSGRPKSTSRHGGHKGFEDKGWDVATPTIEYFNEIKRVSKNQIIWGANYYPQYLKSSSGWILWDKGQRIDQADGEIAFSSFNKALRIFTLNRVSLQIEGTIHPTQKPIKLYEWLLTNYAKQGDKILDTHLGSMSSVIACHNLGFEITGCELDKDYFEAGIKRVQSAMAQIVKVNICRASA